MLALHAHRVIPLFWKVAAIQDVHSILVSQILVHLLHMAFQDGFITPGPFADEVLGGTNGIGVCACQGQDHGLNGLVGNVRQQTIQVRLGPFPLLATSEQGAVDGMVLPQFIDQMINILEFQIHLRNRFDGFWRLPFWVMVRLDLWRLGRLNLASLLLVLGGRWPLGTGPSPTLPAGTMPESEGTGLTSRLANLGHQTVLKQPGRMQWPQGWARYEPWQQDLPPEQDQDHNIDRTAEHIRRPPCHQSWSRV